MRATAIKLQKGSRLQLEVSSSNFPKYDRNPNTGEIPWKQRFQKRQANGFSFKALSIASDFCRFLKER
jgi:predicted acyl esterase